MLHTPPPPEVAEDLNRRFLARSALRSRLPWVRNWVFTSYEISGVCDVMTGHAQEISETFRVVIPKGVDPKHYLETAASIFRHEHAATKPPLRLVSAQ
jgi:hypothetical protein